MSSLDPIESRSLSTGIAIRTLKNLDFIKQAFAEGKDVHVVVQTVNSLLGLLMFPVEKETQFFKPLESVSLAPPSYFFAVHQSLPDFPLLPSLKIVQFENCTNLTRFFRRLRNAIAHRRIDFSSDSRDIAAVIITLRDKPQDRNRPIDWEIELSAEDLEQLSRYIAHRVIDAHL
jgi:HEPN pEK499 p136